MKDVKPGPPGPWSPYRWEIMRKIGNLGLQRGDIAVRLGNATVTKPLGDLMELGQEVLDAIGIPDHINVALRKGGIQAVPLQVTIPFSSIIAATSGSEYSHAAMVLDGGQDPLMLEVGPNGMGRLFFREWLDDIRGNDVLFLRYCAPDAASVISKVSGLILVELDRDPDYNSDFSLSPERLYCVQLPYLLYERAGASLGNPTRFCDLPGWSMVSELVALAGNINRETPVYHVGNSREGLLSSSKLKVSAKISIHDGVLLVERSSWTLE